MPAMNLNFAALFSFAIVTAAPAFLVGQVVTPTADNPFGRTGSSHRVARSILVPVIESTSEADQILERSSSNLIGGTTISPFQIESDPIADEAATMTTLPARSTSADSETSLIGRMETEFLPAMESPRDIGATSLGSATELVIETEPVAESETVTEVATRADTATAYQTAFQSTDPSVSSTKSRLATLAESNQVVVHQPTTKPTAPNRYYFRIENAGNSTVTDLTVELSVPAPAKIIEVVPYETMVKGQTAHFHVPLLKAGANNELEITVTPGLDTEVTFDSRLIVKTASQNYTTSRKQQPTRSLSTTQQVAQPKSSGRLPTRRPALVAEKVAVAQQKTAKEEVKHNRRNVTPPTLVPTESIVAITVPSQPVSARTVKAKPVVAQTMAAHAAPATRPTPPAPMPKAVVPAPVAAGVPIERLERRSPQAERNAWRQNSQLGYGYTARPAGVMIKNPFLSAGGETTGTETADVQHSDLVSKQTLMLEPPLDESRTQNKIANDYDNLAPEPVVASDATAGSSLFQLQAVVNGPQHSVTGDENEYVVEVTNSANTAATDVLIQLQIPKGLQVTTLDRDAWFDAGTQTVTWKLSKLAAGQTEAIRYLALVKSDRDQLQMVTLGMKNTFQGQSTFESKIMNQHQLAAPLLPFEKVPNSLK